VVLVLGVPAEALREDPTEAASRTRWRRTCTKPSTTSCKSSTSRILRETKLEFTRYTLRKLKAGLPKLRILCEDRSTTWDNIKQTISPSFIPIYTFAQKEVRTYKNLSYTFAFNPLYRSFLPTSQSPFIHVEQLITLTIIISSMVVPLLNTNLAQTTFKQTISPLVLVFCRPTSEFIRILRCSRKTMVASKRSKRHEELYWFKLELYV
jgi:hypothetical protein